MAQKPKQTLKFNVSVDLKDCIEESGTLLTEYADGFSVTTKPTEDSRASPIFHNLEKAMKTLEPEQDLKQVLESLFIYPCIGCRLGKEMAGSLQKQILVFHVEKTNVSIIASVDSSLREDTRCWAWKAFIDSTQEVKDI